MVSSFQRPSPVTFCSIRKEPSAMDSASNARMTRRTPLGDRAKSLAQIGDPGRPLGPEAALGVTVAALPLTRHLKPRLDTRRAAVCTVEALLGVQLPGPSTW